MKRASVLRIILPILVLLLWNFESVSGDGEDSLDLFLSDTPKFTTKGTTYRAVIGDTIVLPCQAENLGRYLLLWKRGTSVLSVGDLKVSIDPRIQLVDEFNLQIRKVRIHDAGDYVCQMNTLTPQEQTYTLEVLVPPSVRTEPSNGHVTITKGDTMTLQCRANGNPVPNIRWTRKNNLLPTGEQSIDGNSLTIQKAGRHHAGIYICSASNGVGAPVSTSIHVKVQFPPEVEVERNLVHAGEGFEAELACIVHSDPPAVVRWYRDTLLLHMTDRRLIEERGARHSLIIRKIHESDFGNYTCEADNKLGRLRRHLELTGKPNRALFRSDPKGKFPDSFNLTWTIESFSPVQEYRLIYRKAVANANENETKPHALAQGMFIMSEWNDVVLPAVDYSRTYPIGNSLTAIAPGSTLAAADAIISGSATPGSILHVKSYLIRNLEPHTIYEARVSARNKFGVSQLSDIFSFRTRTIEMDQFEGAPQNDLYSDPEFRDIGILSSSPSIYYTNQNFMMIFLVFSLIFNAIPHFV